MNYLINEPPLVLLPSLATAIGLNEALVLQQIQYWLSRGAKEKEGRLWIYNTYEAWTEQFPFWSKPTIVRTIANLEKMGVVLTANYNKAKFDKTKWYTIDYDKLQKIVESTDVIKLSKRCYQNDKTMLSNCIDGDYQNDKTYTRYYTDTTTDTTQKDNNVVLDTETQQLDKVKINQEQNHFVEQSSTLAIPYSEILHYLNEKMGFNVKAEDLTHEVKEYIKNQFKAGYTLEDFKMMIDRRSSVWESISEMPLVPRSKVCLHFEEYKKQMKTSKVLS